MATETERVVRWKALAVISIAGFGALLVVHGYLTGAEWVQAVGAGIKGLFGA